jgi:hypothetical protein
MQIRTSSAFFVFGCLFLVAGGSGCGSSPSSPSSSAVDPAAFAQKYKIADNQIPNWTQDPSTDPSANWSGTDLVASGIDGGNERYDSRGFKQGLFQTLDGPNQQQCNFRAMDFGTDANATTMFTYAVQNAGATVPVPPFAISVAAGETVIGGATVFAHFKASYFEVYMTGYADTASAISDSELFLTVFQTDTN